MTFFGLSYFEIERTMLLFYFLNLLLTTYFLKSGSVCYIKFNQIEAKCQGLSRQKKKVSGVNVGGTHQLTVRDTN
jgi:hypothetical protein